MLFLDVLAEVFRHYLFISAIFYYTHSYQTSPNKNGKLIRNRKQTNKSTVNNQSNENYLSESSPCMLVKSSSFPRDISVGRP